MIAPSGPSQTMPDGLAVLLIVGMTVTAWLVPGRSKVARNGPEAATKRVVGAFAGSRLL